MLAAVQRERDYLRGEALNRLLAIRQLRPLIFECPDKFVDIRQLVERKVNVCGGEAEIVSEAPLGYP
ncbi:MAG: hypothetical protein ACYDGR_14615 [Candidatus Dormibacteria bacterium]